MTEKKIDEIMAMELENILMIDDGSGMTVTEVIKLEQEEQRISKLKRSFPWGFTKDEIKEALKAPDGNRKRALLEEAYRVLKQFFTEVLV
jgi:hypothetical protein